MSHIPGTEEQSPFVRTLHGGSGIPGSEVVADRTGSIYKLGRRLGTTGDVFELEDSAFAEPAVIKLFPRAAGLDAYALDAFARAAAAASAIGHPQIARTLDAGVLENGTPFLVVERLTGQTLKELLAHRVALAPADGLALLRAVGGALSAAHEAGLVHGELRPDNIFVVDSQRRAGPGRGPAVKVLDFGVSYLTAPLRQMGLAVSDEALSFLSPEQMQVQVLPDELDGRTDEYALAVVAHRLLAPAQARRSPALTAVLSMARSEKAADRFDSIELFLTALGEVVGGAGSTAAFGVRRETLKPLPDTDITPIGGGTPSPRPMPRHLARGGQSGGYGTMTRQFFEEGNRMDEEAVAAARNPSLAVATSGASLSALRIPTHRGRKVVAAVAVLAVAGVVAMAWSGMWGPLLAVRENAGVVFSKLQHPNGSEARPLPPTGASAPIKPAIPVASAAAPAAPGAAIAAAPMPSPSVVTEQPTPRTEKTAVAAAPVAASPKPSPERATAPSPTAQRPKANETIANPGDDLASSRRPAPAVQRASGRHEPLRGYVWSPKERRLVRSNRSDADAPLPLSRQSTSSLSSSPPSSAPAQWAVPSPSAASFSSLPVPSPIEPPPQAPPVLDPGAHEPSPSPAPSPAPVVP
ncbi:MAG TPA: protein kinase [Polyangia bacterium]|nr:protein kinase [Polyangia bacterium]